MAAALQHPYLQASPNQLDEQVASSLVVGKQHQA